MKVDILDYKTGWYGIQIGIKESELDMFIDSLKRLRNQSHFHLRSSFEGNGGVGDVEIYAQMEESENNLVVDVSPPIYPKK